MNSYAYYPHVLSITDNMLLAVDLLLLEDWQLRTVYANIYQYQKDSHAITRRVIQGKCLPPSDVSVKRCNNFLIIYFLIFYLILLAALEASCGQMVKQKKSTFNINGTTSDFLNTCQCALNLPFISSRCSFVNCIFE